jgi:hypothetical protein
MKKTRFGATGFLRDLLWPMFSLLEIILRPNRQNISEIPPRPPLRNGGEFWEIHQYGNIAFLVPAWPGQAVIVYTHLAL